MSSRAHTQILVVGLALGLWSLWPEPAFWSFVLAYLLALLVLTATGLHERAARWSARDCLLLALALALPGLFSAFRVHRAWLENEALVGIWDHTLERWQGERMPAIAPGLVVGDRPQTFFVHARASAKVAVKFGVRARELQALELGQGLYRVSYDPRRDGALEPADGQLSARLTIDGEPSTRDMLAATPRAHPRWFARSLAGDFAATVSEESDELIIASARGLERRIKVGDGPLDCVFLDAERVAVSHRDDALWLVDAQSGRVLNKLALPGPQGRLASNADHSLLVVARVGRTPGLFVIDVAKLTLLGTTPLDLPADWLAFAGATEQLFVTARRDASIRAMTGAGAGFRETSRVLLGRPVVTLAAQGTHLFAATTDYREDGSLHLGNHFVQDQVLMLDTEPLRVRSSFLTARRSPRQGGPGELDRGISPLGLAPAQDGSLWLAFAGSEELWHVHADRPEPEIVDLNLSDLYAPHGVVELADGTVLVSSPSAGALATLAKGTVEPRVFRLEPDDDYLRKHAPEAYARRLGERGFYEATRSGISCQSCHLHADSDLRGHNLGTHGLLPTLSVRGLYGTGPYLRDGSFVDIAALDHVAQTLYRGYLRKTPSRAQFLQSYVYSLPRMQSEGAGDVADVRAGASVFVAARCPACHGLPRFTSQAQLLAASVFPSPKTRGDQDEVLDVPSLLSVASSAPYLSDGRAHALEDVLFVYNRADRHGHTRDLSPRERELLLAFLESL